MTFTKGKYKGYAFSDVERMDPGYIRWCKINAPYVLPQKPKKVTVDQEEVKEWEENQKLRSYLKQHPGKLEDAF